MKIEKMPENLTGVFGNVVYVISAEKSETADIEILSSDGSEVVAVRRLSGCESYCINASNYVNAQMRVEPDVESGTGVVAKPEAAVCCSVKVGEETSEVSVHCAGTEKMDYLKPMCVTECKRTLYGDGRDEVMFVSDGSEVSWVVEIEKKNGETAEVLTGVIETEKNGAYSFVVDERDIRLAATEIGIGNADFSVVRMRAVASGTEFVNESFGVKKKMKSGVCVAWLNVYGGIDREWFRVLESKMEIDSVMAEKSEGCESLGAIRSEILKLSSPIMGSAEFERVAKIVSSPKIWIVGENEVTPVVIENRELVHVAGKMNQVVIDVRKSYGRTPWKF